MPSLVLLLPQANPTVRGMGTSSRIAHSLDTLAFDRNRVRVRYHLIGAKRPNARPGQSVARQLRGRLLVRYITEAAASSTSGPALVTTEVYATPTAYSPEEAPIWLLTPGATLPRPYCVLLDPAAIDWIIGPLFVGPAAGIQYILPFGYPAEAVIVPGAPTGHWYLPVT